MKKLLLLILISLLFQNIQAQEFGTKGKEFWLTYMENLDLLFNGDPQFSVFVSAESSGTATILAPATGFTQSFDYLANEVTEYILPPALFYAEGSESIENLGLKISTETETNVFAVHYRIYFSEATGLLPIDVLGNEYIVSAAADYNTAISSPSSFVILATEDNTEIEIIPSTLTLGLRPAELPFSVTLNAGQIFQVQAIGDLSGTNIRSINNEKFAVFGGALKGYVECDNFADNHLYDQLYPLGFAEKSYALIPFKDQGGSLFKILATEDNTEVLLNGAFFTTLQKGESVENYLETPKILTADKGVFVTQFNPSQDCNTSQLGDPNMLQLSSLNYRIKKTNFENLLGFGNNNMMFSRRNLTLFTETENTSNVLVDNNPVNFLPFPDYPEYSFALLELNTGTSRLEAPDGVMAYTYGFGDYDAYTYHLGFDAAMSTSNQEITSIDFYTIYPNPTTDWIEIQSQTEIENLQIFDLQGRLVLQDSDMGVNTKVDLSSLNSSVYILKIKSGNKIFRKKLIKID